MVSFCELTTIGVGGNVLNYEKVQSRTEAKSAIDSLNGTDFKIVGGGSNVLPKDGVFRTPLVHLVPNLSLRYSKQDYIWAGQSLDEVAQRYHLSALSGIPGTLGGAIVQNAGAYGAQISDFVHSVEVYDFESKKFEVWSKLKCQFNYRNSHFKQLIKENTCNFLVTGARLEPAQGFIRVEHPQLASALGVSLGSQKTAEEVREQVLFLRDQKGMLAPLFNYGSKFDTDRNSCGSFFTNPLVPEFYKKFLPSDTPTYTSGKPGYIKVSAAFLIEQAGITRGFKLPEHKYATVSSKHTLAITNTRPSYTNDAGAEVRELSKYIQAQVHKQFNIELEPEVVIL
ncbi:UDP-N-acetylenolpyruvoylglucosamine reductase [Actinomycetota bacterium]|nr:UDP-N-acetylenolpyruvoylglucosamine reductase [Actinomycetota bacterium]